MDLSKEEVFEQLKHELQSAALNRMDNGNIYIFMKDRKNVADNYNLLIFDADAVKKSNYSFVEKSGNYFLNMDGITYEIMMPEAISDEEAFTLTIKNPVGVLLRFENYI